MILTLLIFCLLCAAIPCALFCYNLRLYTPPPLAAHDLPAVSILIPARNEADGIADAITTALATRGVAFELVIMNDASTDATAQIVRTHADQDPRVRLEQAPPLPPGWNGKQHACWALAQAARSPILCFVDADVRLQPDCIARMATFLARAADQTVEAGEEVEAGGFSPVNTPTQPKGASAPATLALVSGFPRQLTGSPLEWLLIPLIHFVLLGFLPLSRMRKTTDPAFAAGCGQFLMCARDAYFATGGHSGIKLTMHDGLRLPRLFREHGYQTDLADLTPLTSVRMYTTTRDTWQGLAKNATEGLGAPARIVPISAILMLGQVVPFAILTLIIAIAILLLILAKTVGIGVFSNDWLKLCLSASVLFASVVAAWLPRILAARRFRQDWRSALLHPFGILLLLAVQWYALVRKLRGGQVSWRGRAYTKTSA